MLEKIEGIVLKTQDYGETHKIVTIFSGKIGKFAAISRGAKKPKSRMSAVTQPFIYGNYLIYVNKGLSSMQQGEIVQSFRVIREDIVKTAYTAYIAELTDKLLDDYTPETYLYDQFYQTLQWIVKEREAMVPIMMYELKLFQKGGFAPVVDRCVHCGGKQSPFSFSFLEGGLLCSECQSVDTGAITLSMPLVKLLHHFLHVGLERVGNITVKKENIRFLRKLLNAYYDQYGGYYLKSRKFLDQLDQFQM